MPKSITEELLEGFRRWRDEVDQDHILDTFDLALGWFAGRGHRHELCLKWARMLRDEDA